MKVNSRLHGHYVSKLFNTIVLCIFVIIAFLVINQYLTVNTTSSINDTISNIPCNHDVHVNNPDGTTNVVQRCYPLLMNFAHKCCRQAQKQNCRTGLAHGVRQCLKMDMSVFDNDPRFAKKNKHIIEQKRGAGYWLWKPYMLLKELYLAREGDIIIYSDAAVDIIQNIEYLTNLTRFQDVITFQQQWQEYVWTKRDALIIMDIDKPSYYNSSAGVASYMILRKSLMSMTFISEWLTYAQDSRALTDEKNVFEKKNYDGFREHRHDQSILGLLAKKWNLTVYPDPSQWGETVSRPYPTIFDHHRSKN